MCALCRRLSLDADVSRPALELLHDGLELRTRRSGVVFLEPLRRLALLAAAAAPEPSAPWPEPLLACVQTLAATDASAPEFAPIPPVDVRAVLGEARCCDAAAGRRQKSSSGAFDSSYTVIMDLSRSHAAGWMGPVRGGWRLRKFGRDGAPFSAIVPHDSCPLSGPVAGAA